jgi:hypothetical protein
MHRMVLIVAVAATLIANQSQAQTDFHMLRGLSQVHILIEPLNGERTCGLTEASIREAVMYPLSSSKIKVVSYLTDVVFYVGITSIYLKESRICFSNALVEPRGPGQYVGGRRQGIKAHGALQPVRPATAGRRAPARPNLVLGYCC